MKVMNIGIIIRNDHDDTFPVALTPQMVSVIQNLLTQIPVLNSKLVGADGKKVASNPSIPIIPRAMEFDWDRAYTPMMPEEEQKLMKELNDKYIEDEANKPEETESSDAAKEGGIIVPEGMGKDDDEDPEKKVTPLFKDKDNPFNLSLKAEGRANVDLEKAGSDTEPDPDADDKVSVGSSDDAETAGAENTGEGLFEDTTLDADKAKAEEAKNAGTELDKQTGAEEVEGGATSEVDVASADTPPAGDGDCTVTPVDLKLKGSQEKIGG
jgi:hypothetical protein